MRSAILTTTDGYSTANTVEWSFPSQRVTFTVLNNPAMAQFKLSTDENLREADWNSQEVEMIPGVWGFSPDDFNGAKILGVRLRSENAGQSARVSISA